MSTLDLSTKQIGAIPKTAARDNIYDNSEDIGLLAVNQVLDRGWSIAGFKNGYADAFNDETGVNTGTTTAVYQSGSNRYVNAGSSFELKISSDTTDGSTTFTDSSGNGYTVTPTNVTHEDTIAKWGATSIYYNGSTSFLTTTKSANFDFSNAAWHFDAWINPDTLANDQGIFGKWIDGNNNIRCLIYANGDILVTWTTGGVSHCSLTATSTGITDSSGWHHVAVESYSGTVYIYVDGAVANSVAISGTPSYIDADLVFGSRLSAATYFNGYMDEIAFTWSESLYDGASYSVPAGPYSGTIPYVFFTAAQTTASDPNVIGGVVVLETSSTINTDIVCSVSRDGGTTYTTADLTFYANYSVAGLKVYSIAWTDVTAQPSGTSVVIKLESKNNTYTGIYRLYQQWSLT